MGNTAKGILAMVAACMIWGLSPLFYVHLAHVPPLEVLAHRSIWSLVTFGMVLGWQGRLSELPRALGSARKLALALIAVAMISTNWFLFIYAIGSGRTVEASLGYYMYPLVAVAIGAVVLREPLGTGQAMSVGLAALAVLILTLGLGATPWISLAIGITFGVYGLLKRWVAAGPVVSVSAEVALLFPMATGYLIWSGSAGHFASSIRDGLLLIMSGPMTAMPLILFSLAIKRTTMATVGLIQYLNPTLQFLVAALILAESVTRWHMIAFPLIWLALALYSWASLRGAKSAARAA